MTRANPALIGSFILGALALALGGLFILGSGKLLADTVSCVMYFQGAVQGLNVGAAVNFRGVKVGTVKDIKMQFNPQTFEIHIAVIAEFPKGAGGRMETLGTHVRAPQEALKALIERGLRAQLQLESLVTGLLFIQLDFYDYDPLAGAGLAKARRDPATQLLEIPTVPTTLQEISQTVRKALDSLAELPLAQMVIDLSDMLHGVRELVTSPEIKDFLRNINVTMGRTQHLVQQLEHEMGRLTSGATATLGRLDQLATETRQAIRQLSKDVERLVTSTTTTLGATGKLVQKVDTPLIALMGSLQETSNAVRTTLNQTQETLSGMQQMLAPQAPVGYELVQTLRELGDAARSLRVLAEYIERHPSALVFGRDEGKSP